NRWPRVGWAAAQGAHHRRAVYAPFARPITRARLAVDPLGQSARPVTQHDVVDVLDEAAGVLLENHAVGVHAVGRGLHGVGVLGHAFVEDLPPVGAFGGQRRAPG